MANLVTNENPQWQPEIWQIETTTPWVGGENGTANVQAKLLKERTDFLKRRSDEVDEAKEGAGSLKARIEAIGAAPRALHKREFITDVPVAASTENIDLVEGGLLVVDGVQTQAGDLVFLKDQLNPIENGFWEAQTGAWNRFDGYGAGAHECFTNKYIDINSGAVNKDKVFYIDADAYTVGEAPLIFKASFLTSGAARPGTALFRNRAGKVEELESLTPISFVIFDDSKARSLPEVLGYMHTDPLVYIPQTMAELRRICNGTGKPDFSGLRLGDYINGIDLSALPAENGGDAGQAWNDTYKNNQIVIAGFNHYKGIGDSENTKNHVLFTFKNIPLRKRMNATNDNAGGYAASEMRAFLEGVNGNGTGDKAGVTTAAFLNALKAQLAGGGEDNYLYTFRNHTSNKGSWSWKSFTVFLPAELELMGYPCFGDEGMHLPAFSSPALLERLGYVTYSQFPLYQGASGSRVKRRNGSRDWHWLATPSSSSAAYFCNISNYGHANYNNASSAGGCAPAFCVA